MRETVEALRAIFRREKVTMHGKMINIDGFRLDVPFETPPPIYIGAQGSLMLRIAGEIGDGVIVNFITPETLPPMLDETVREGRQVGKIRRSSTSRAGLSARWMKTWRPRATCFAVR